jgi:hypothetical protein
LGRVTTTGPGIFSLLGTALGGGAGAGGGPAAFNNRIFSSVGDPGPEPDPLVLGLMDPDPDRLRILPFSQKVVEQTEIMLAK